MRKEITVDGILNVYKPKEWTSHDIVAKIKKITGQKVGHTGTLDPLAQGVLPVLIGKGTLCSKYLVNHDKKYRVELKLGKRTATLDAEGEILQGYTEQSNVNVVREMVDMITITRAYEASQKVIHSYDSMLDKSVNQVGALK